MIEYPEGHPTPPNSSCAAILVQGEYYTKSAGCRNQSTTICCFTSLELLSLPPQDKPEKLWLLPALVSTLVAAWIYVSFASSVRSSANRLQMVKGTWTLPDSEDLVHTGWQLEHKTFDWICLLKYSMYNNGKNSLTCTFAQTVKVKVNKNRRRRPSKKKDLQSKPHIIILPYLIREHLLFNAVFNFERLYFKNQTFTLRHWHRHSRVATVGAGALCTQCELLHWFKRAQNRVVAIRVQCEPDLNAPMIDTCQRMQR